MIGKVGSLLLFVISLGTQFIEHFILKKQKEEGVMYFKNSPLDKIWIGYKEKYGFRLLIS
jgi:hypothetical protein